MKNIYDVILSANMTIKESTHLKKEKLLMVENGVWELEKKKSEIKGKEKGYKRNKRAIYWPNTFKARTLFWKIMT